MLNQEEKNELVVELRKQFEQYLMLFECAVPLVKEALNSASNYLPVIEEFVMKVQQMQSRLNANFIKELQFNGFTKDEAMQLLLKQQNNVQKLLKNVQANVKK